MTGTDLCVNKPHKSRSYLNHLVLIHTGSIHNNGLHYLTLIKMMSLTSLEQEVS